MAKAYRVSTGIRVWNALARVGISAGFGARRWRILTVRGRKTGRAYSTPVSLVTVEGRAWLVSPYGRRGWAANALALGEVELRRGRDARTFRVREVPPEQAAPVLRAYYAQEPITRPYFDVTLESSDADFALEAPRHPVFSLEEIQRVAKR
ncbi:MAG: nitroreductase family deazaflavin-dependent oxidoreductase [Dehalococcoidia bacterium]|nr:nitroreductase family deazaflavin-dependent oxidoreductase [Dehalococcoidia bacterium]